MPHRLSAALIALALAAVAAPSQAAGLELKDVVAQVVVVTEPRSDVSVTILRTNPRAPLTIRRSGDDVIVSGRKDNWWARTFGGQSLSCNIRPGGAHVSALGIGSFSRDQLPSLLVRMPLGARISTSGAVLGSLPTADSLALDIGGCDVWTIGQVKGRLDIHDAGAGRVLVGDAGEESAELSGTGEVRSGFVRRGLTVKIAGVGTVTAGQASGLVDVHIAGQGRVVIAGGQASRLSVEIDGQGQVTDGGVADSLDAHIAGQGDIRVAKVTGAVSREVAGMGTVTVGGVDQTVADAQADLTRHW